MPIHVVNEAKRCLQCKNPRCRTGCPINTPIPDMIRLFRENELEQAGEMLFRNNPLSVVCSLVCDHEKQCEGHCVLGIKGAPVHISSIENYISDAYLDRMDLETAPKKNQRAAIIGSGPAGITIAVLLAQRGYDVTLFESREKIGGVLRYGIPAFRLPKEILDRYKDQLVRLGIKIRPNTAIGQSLTVDDLQRDGYEAIFIGTGVWRPKKMGIPGESLGHVHFAIDYLVNPDVYDLGSDLVVIGAGNSPYSGISSFAGNSLFAGVCYYYSVNHRNSCRERHVLEGGCGAVGDNFVVGGFAPYYNAKRDNCVVLFRLREHIANMRQLSRARNPDKPDVFGIDAAAVESLHRVAHERVHEFLVEARGGYCVPVSARVDFWHFTFVETHFRIVFVRLFRGRIRRTAHGCRGVS